MNLSFFRRKRWWLETGLVAGVCALTVWGVFEPRTEPKVTLQASLSPRPSATFGPSTSPVVVADPLTIAGMRSKRYSASPIVVRRQLGEQGGYTAAVVSFNSDGYSEQAYQAVPDGVRPASGWPVIVLVHGYIPPSSYSTTGNAYVSWIAAWARAGFMVVQPDLRGNGTSGGEAVSGHWSADYTTDVMNLLSSLKTDTAVNGSKIGLAGHSMGGHVALNAAVISPDVKATVLANGVVGTMYDLLYDWPNSPAPNDQPVATTRGELATLEAKYGTPKTNPAWWDSASAIKYVSSVAGPVQINADTGDVTVPYAFSQELDNALRAAGKPVTFNSYPGNDHQLSQPANLAAFLARTTAFWQQQLR